jgi:hypothetical protein
MKKIYSTILIPIQRVENMMIEQNRHNNIRIVRIVIPAYVSMMMNISTTERFNLFSTGYKTMKDEFQNDGRD